MRVTTFGLLVSQLETQNKDDKTDEKNIERLTKLESEANRYICTPLMANYCRPAHTQIIQMNS